MGDLAIVYMVAGLSSRFGGRIKSFVKITEEDSLIEYSLSQALPAGFTKIIFVVSKETEKQFKEKFKDSYKGIPVYYCLQEYDKEKRDKPWGTADALCSAEEILDCPFVIANGDDLYGKEAFDILNNSLRNNEDATIGYKLNKVLPKLGDVNRGIFKKDEQNYIQSIKEIYNLNRFNFEELGLTLDTLCNMNLYALSIPSLKLISNTLKRFKEENRESRTAECLVQNAISQIISEQKMKVKVYTSKENWFGITNPGDEITLKKQLEELNKN